MKRIVLINLFAWSLLATTYAQSLISFSQESFDMNEVEIGDVVEGQFSFVNIGDQELMLTSVRASCDCLEPIWSSNPVSPGDSSHIKFRFHSKGKMGNQNRNLIVLSNDTVNTPKMLMISGYVVNRKTTTDLPDTSYVDFGIIKPHKTQVASIQLENTGEGDLLHFSDGNRQKINGNFEGKVIEVGVMVVQGKLWSNYYGGFVQQSLSPDNSGLLIVSIENYGDQTGVLNRVISLDLNTRKKHYLKITAVLEGNNSLKIPLEIE